MASLSNTAPVRSGPGLQALRDLPHDVQRMRDLLFEMPVPFSIRADVFDFFWPLVDNVWCKQSQGIVGGSIDGGAKVSFDSVRLPCRFARVIYDASRPSTSANPPSAKRKRREGGTCSCRVKAKVFRGIAGIPDHYLFDHSSQKESDWVHSHTLDESDGYKINSFIKTAAAQEIAKGQMPAEVYRLLRDVTLGNSANSALIAAGGKFMTRQHVGNAKQSLERPPISNMVQVGPDASYILPTNVMDYTKQQYIKPPEVMAMVTRSYASPYGTSTSPIDLDTRNSFVATPEIINVTPSPSATSWPSLGLQPENHDQHKAQIRMETCQLIGSTVPGTQIPREVLLPLLNSFLAYLDRDVGQIDGKALLAAIHDVQQTVIATRENTEKLMSRQGFYGQPPNGV
ncbi:hypothetical protein PVAG01_08470 [Phlyctema vagabunda]|uniref:Uncharacterized protein n=1 Tax=Phlyctema vagabunda TaxID=108571 RepID=A0ABR4P9H5_9HELO